MKGITEIDEQAAVLLVRAYKAAHMAEGPRIRAEVWQDIARELNRQNTRNLTVAQWKKRISNIKSLVKLKQDMEKKGRQVNWTSVEQEYVRLFPHSVEEPQAEAKSELPSMVSLELGLAPADGFARLAQLERLVRRQEEEQQPAATMVKPELEWAESASGSSESEPAAAFEALSPLGLDAEQGSTDRSESAPASALPFLDLRALLAQMSDLQRKQHMLCCLRSFRQQIDFFVEFLEQDLVAAGMTL